MGVNIEEAFEYIQNALFEYATMRYTFIQFKEFCFNSAMWRDVNKAVRFVDKWSNIHPTFSLICYDNAKCIVIYIHIFYISSN